MRSALRLGDSCESDRATTDSESVLCGSRGGSGVRGGWAPPVCGLQLPVIYATDLSPVS